MTRPYPAIRTAAAALLLVISGTSSGLVHGGDVAPATDQEEIQNERTLRWHVSVVPTQAKPGDEIEIIFTADIADGWILYASDFSLEFGPRPAKFTFDDNPSLQLLGDIESIRSQRKKDRVFDSEYTYFAGRAEFRQKAKITGPINEISGRIDGQTCFEATGLCELVRDTFRVSVK